MDSDGAETTDQCSLFHLLLIGLIHQQQAVKGKRAKASLTVLAEDPILSNWPQSMNLLAGWPG